MRRLRILGALMLAATVVACGFHLRGAYDVPEHLSPIYLNKESMSLPLYRALRSTFKTSGVALAGDSDAAASILRIDREQQTRDVVSVDSLGRAREYRLVYRLTFSLDAGEETLIEESKVQLTRNLLFNPETVLGVAEEQNNIHMEMVADSARQILQRMQALKQGQPE